MSKRKVEILLAIAGGIILPLLIFALTPIWSARFADKKGLTYKVISRFQIGGLEFSRETWPELTIRYRDQALERGTLVAVTVSNDGNAPVRSADFEGPIQLRLSRAGVVLGFRVVFATPKDLRPSAVLTDSTLEIAPMLFNARDAFVIELVGRDTFSIIGAAARIAGVPSVKEGTEQQDAGLFLESVRTEDYGRTAHSALLRVPLGVLFAAQGLGFFVGVILFLMARRIRQEFMAVTYFSAAVALIAAMMPTVALTRALSSRGLSIWAVFGLFTVIYFMSVGAALFSLRRILFAPRAV